MEIMKFTKKLVVIISVLPIKDSTTKFGAK